MQLKNHLTTNGWFNQDWRQILLSLKEISKVEPERRERFGYGEGSIPLASLLKAFSVPYTSITEYRIRNGGNGEFKTIGDGTLFKAGVDWDLGLIGSNNTIIFYKDEQGKDREFTLDYEAYRDLRGNVRRQIFKENGQRVLDINVWSYNKFGIGRDSMIQLKLAGGWTPLEIARYTGLKRVNLMDLYGKQDKKNAFMFEVSRINRPTFSKSNGDDFAETYQEVQKRFTEFTSGQLVREKLLRDVYLVFKSGPGKIIVRGDGYEIGLDGRLKGNPLFLTFPLYKTGLLSTTEAGPINFGYGSQSYMFVFDEKTGFDSYIYSKPSWWVKWPVFNKLMDTPPVNAIWDKSGFISRISDLKMIMHKVNGGTVRPAVTYTILDSRMGKEDMRKGTYDFFGNFPFEEEFNLNISPFLKSTLDTVKRVIYDDQFPFYPVPVKIQNGSGEVLEKVEHLDFLMQQTGDTLNPITKMQYKRKNLITGIWETRVQYIHLNKGLPVRAPVDFSGEKVNIIQTVTPSKEESKNEEKDRTVQVGVIKTPSGPTNDTGKYWKGYAFDQVWFIGGIAMFVVSLFFGLITGMASRWLYRTRIQKKDGIQLFGRKVWLISEERRALKLLRPMKIVEDAAGKRLTFMRRIIEEARVRLTDGPVEVNFINSLRGLYALVMEWRRIDNRLGEITQQVENELLENNDTWLNGLDNFATVIAYYIRFVIKQGKKDSELSEDGNHIWSRLEAHIGELVERMRIFLAEYIKAQEAKDQVGMNEANRKIAAVLEEKGIIPALPCQSAFVQPADNEQDLMMRIRVIQHFVQGLIDLRDIKLVLRLATGLKENDNKWKIINEALIDIIQGLLKDFKDKEKIAEKEKGTKHQNKLKQENRKWLLKELGNIINEAEVEIVQLRIVIVDATMLDLLAALRTQLKKLADAELKAEPLNDNIIRIEGINWDNNFKHVFGSYTKIETEKIDNIINVYKQTKQREGRNFLPYNPLSIRMARYLPSFIALNLVSLLWFNAAAHGPSLLGLLWNIFVSFPYHFAGLGLLFGIGISVHYAARMIINKGYANEISFKLAARSAKAANILQWVSYAVRFVASVGMTVCTGYYLAGTELLSTQKALIGFLGLLIPAIEAMGIAVPLILTWLSALLQKNAISSGWLGKKFNRLSFFAACRPTSIIALSLRYHYRPQVATGGTLGMIGAITFYVGLLVASLWVGWFLGTETFGIYFHDFLSMPANTFEVILKIAGGALMFFLAQYLLRYAVGIGKNSLGTVLATFPVIALSTIAVGVANWLNAPIVLTWAIAAIGMSVSILWGDLIKEKVIDAKKRLNKPYLHFAQSRAFSRKIRESWKLIAWFTAFVRWSGGLFQKMSDRIMQETGELGPLSVFAREVRAHNARFFTSVRQAIIFILMLPISSLLGFNPFKGVLLSLCIIGAISNQIIRLNGGIAYMEAQGFNRVTAVIGGLIGAYIGVDPMSVVIGVWLGGFIKGISRWLIMFLEDIIKFPLQTLIHALAQRLYQTLEFNISSELQDDYKGGDVKEKVRQKSAETFVLPSRTFLWGAALVLMNIAAISFDTLLSNTILLYPFLLFSVALTIGLFAANITQGAFTYWQYAARAVGWIGAAGALWIIRYLAPVLLTANVVAMGIGILIVVGALNIKINWKCFTSLDLDMRVFIKGFIATLFITAWSFIVPFVPQTATVGLVFIGGLIILGLQLFKHQPIKHFNDKRIDAEKKQLQENRKKRAQYRWLSEGLRAFTMGLFALMWFFWVPVHRGLNIETLGNFINLHYTANVIWYAGAGIIGVIGYFLLGKLVEWIEFKTPFVIGLNDHYKNAYNKFIEQTHQLSPFAFSFVANALTEVQTTIAQGSFKYASRLLDKVDRYLDISDIGLTRRAQGLENELVNLKFSLSATQFDKIQEKIDNAKTAILSDRAIAIELLNSAEHDIIIHKNFVNMYLKVHNAFEQQYGHIANAQDLSLACALLKNREYEKAQQILEFYAKALCVNRTSGFIYAGGDSLHTFGLHLPTEEQKEEARAEGKPEPPEVLVDWFRAMQEKFVSRGVLLFNITADEAKRLLLKLDSAERARGVTLWHPAQLARGHYYAAWQEWFIADIHPLLFYRGISLPREIRVPFRNEKEYRDLIKAWHLRRWLVKMFAAGGKSQDSAICYVEMALAQQYNGTAQDFIMYFGHNKFNDVSWVPSLASESGELNETKELMQREKLAKLIEEMSGVKATVFYSWTPFGFKASFMTAMDIFPETYTLRSLYIVDRNASVFNLETYLEDVNYMLTSPKLVNIIPGRGTTNTHTAVGRGSQSVEEGHRMALRGSMFFGGRAGESIGTGWANNERVAYMHAMDALADTRFILRPQTSRYNTQVPFIERFYAKNFGVQGFIGHAVGISEDIWAIEQQAYVLISCKDVLKSGEPASEEVKASMLASDNREAERIFNTTSSSALESLSLVKELKWLIARKERKFLKEHIDYLRMLYNSLSEHGWPIDYIRKSALLEVVRHIRYDIVKFKHSVDLGIRLANNNIVPSCILEYGVPIVNRFNPGVDEFEIGLRILEEFCIALRDFCRKELNRQPHLGEIKRYLEDVVLPALRFINNINDAKKVIACVASLFSIRNEYEEVEVDKYQPSAADFSYTPIYDYILKYRYFDPTSAIIFISDRENITKILKEDSNLNSSPLNIQTVLRYLAQRDVKTLEVIDLLMILGSSDLRVPEEAAKIYHRGLVEKIIVAGGIGRLTGDLVKPEAQVYRDILMENGVPETAILVEDKSTNTQENIQFSIALMKEHSLNPRSIVVMQTPVLQRRSMATFERWYSVTFEELFGYAPAIEKCISYAPYIPDVFAMSEAERAELLDLAKGELYRLDPKVYGPQGRGYISYINIPSDVKETYEKLAKSFSETSSSPLRLLVKPENRKYFAPYLITDYAKFHPMFKEMIEKPEESPEINKERARVMESSFEAMLDFVDGHRRTYVDPYLDGACEDIAKGLSSILKLIMNEVKVVKAYIGCGKIHSYILLSINGEDEGGFIIDGAADQFFMDNIGILCMPMDAFKQSPGLFWMYNGLVYETSSPLIDNKAKVNNLIPDQGYGALASTRKWIHHPECVEKALEGKFYEIMPVTVQLVPSLLCNFLCWGCTYALMKGDSRNLDPRGHLSRPRNEDKVMQLELMRKVIDDLKDIGTKAVTFTGGGEPLSNPCTLDAMQYAKERGLDIGLFTNGSLLDEPKIKRIISLDPTFVRLSINAGTPHIHDAIHGLRRNSGIFAKVVNNLRLLAKEKIKQGSNGEVSVGYIVNPLNVAEIKILAGILKDIFNESPAGGITGFLIRPTVNYESGKQYPKNLNSVLNELYKQLPREVDAWRDFLFKGIQFPQWVWEMALEEIEHNVKPIINTTSIELGVPKQKFNDVSHPSPKSYDKCLACSHISFISPPQASVYICLEWGGIDDFMIGNLSEESMAQVWKNNRRREVIDMINIKQALKHRCPPVCAMHELNIMLASVEKAISQGNIEEIKRRIFEETLEKRSSCVNFLYPASLSMAEGEGRAAQPTEINTIINAFGGNKALAKKGITLNHDNLKIDPKLISPAETRSGTLFVNPNILRGPPEHLKVIFAGHELLHLLGYREDEARLLTIQYLLTNNLLLAHLIFLKHNDIGLIPDLEWLRLLEQAMLRYQGSILFGEEPNAGSSLVTFGSLVTTRSTEKKQNSSSPLTIPVAVYTNAGLWSEATIELLRSLAQQYGEGIFAHLDELNEHAQALNLKSIEGTPAYEEVIREAPTPEAEESYKSSVYNGEWARLIPAGGDATRLGLGIAKILLDLKELLSPELEHALDRAI
ncbi:MAG: ElyC/SanA/YdcF family protein, partial [Candidatus Omnitrophota bacterium]